MDLNKPVFSIKDMAIGVVLMAIAFTIGIFSWSGSWLDGDEVKRELTSIVVAVLELLGLYLLFWKKKLKDKQDG